jgi:hypothetical protein
MSLYDRQLAKQNVQYWSAQRQRCKRDMLFLGRLLGYNRIDDTMHGPVAALCVQKDDTKPIEAQDKIKERIHLDPRGVYKTTFSVIDSVQWIINFPNIRICKVTATKPLATSIVGEISGHFVHSEANELTDFQLLFPEFCIDPKQARVGTFTCPIRTQQWREDTVMAFSIESAISGYHFDIYDPDDVTNTQNSKNDFATTRVKNNYYTDRKTLLPWGYVNFKGTRYAPNDLAGDLLVKAKPSRTKTLIRAALRLKSGERLQPGEFPAEEDMEINFAPLGLDYDFLKSEYDSDYSSFMTQYMNDSHGGHEVVFPPELVDSATLVSDQIPFIGERYSAWRFPCPARDMRKAGGCMGVVNGGRMFLMDAVTISGAPSLIVEAMIKSLKRYALHRVDIERTPGSEAYDSIIYNASLVEGWLITVNWLEPDDQSTRDIRIRALEPLLGSKRLVIDEGTRTMRDLRNQLFNFGTIADTELVDTLSRVTQHLPASILNQNDLADQRAWEEMRERDLHDRVYGMGIYAHQAEMVAAPEVDAEPEYVPPFDENFADDQIIPGLYA